MSVKLKYQGVLDLGGALGIQNGDVIIEFNGIKIDSMRVLTKVVGEAPVGKVATLKIWRNKKVLTKKIVLGRLEDTEQFKKKPKPTKKEHKEEDTLLKAFGIKVRDVTNKDVTNRILTTGTNGVVILEIKTDSTLSESPIQVGNIIIGLQNEQVKNVTDLENKLKKLKKSKNTSVLLTIIDFQNRSRFVGVKIK